MLVIAITIIVFVTVIILLCLIWAFVPQFLPFCGKRKEIDIMYIA